MTPLTALATEYGAMKADEIVSVLRAAGYIIVDKGAIGRAQREAVAQVREDNDNQVRPLADMALRLLGS